MPIWPFKARNKDVEDVTTFDLRLKQLEGDFVLLRHDWEEVLDRLTRRVARDVAAKRNALKATLDAPAPDAAPDEQPEAIPTKTELWARLRSKRA